MNWRHALVVAPPVNVAGGVFETKEQKWLLSKRYFNLASATA